MKQLVKLSALIVILVLVNIKSQAQFSPDAYGGYSTLSNIGIGTSAFQYNWCKLNMGGNIHMNNNSVNYALQFHLNNGWYFKQDGTNAAFSTHNGGGIFTNHLTLTTDGKVGIGVTTPSAFLNINKTTGSASDNKGAEIILNNTATNNTLLCGLNIETTSNCELDYYYYPKVCGIKVNVKETNTSGWANLYGGYFVADSNPGEGISIGLYAEGWVGIVAKSTNAQGTAGQFTGKVYISDNLYAQNNLIVSNDLSVSKNLSIGPTASSNSVITLRNHNESTTQTNFTTAVTNAGILVTTEYTANAFTPGLFWSTSNNNATRPKAGIYLKENNNGTYMYLGTSNLYATGITNHVVITPTGTIEAKELKIVAQPGADFVFNKSYPLPSLKDIENFITENQHLPGVAPAAEMEAKGVEQSKYNQMLLQKIEELTLYMIEQDKKLAEQDKKIETQQKLIESLLEEK